MQNEGGGGPNEHAKRGESERVQTSEMQKSRNVTIAGYSGCCMGSVQGDDTLKSDPMFFALVTQPAEAFSRDTVE